jgi:hypothetical protein
VRPRRLKFLRISQPVAQPTSVVADTRPISVGEQTGMSTILLGIDGTGDISNASYGREMGNSFVAYIIRHSKAKLKRYIRGPSIG